MHTCDACGAEFETLSQLRLRHDDCPVKAERRKREAAVQRLQDERGLEIGDLCRVLSSGKEVEIVDIDPDAEGNELTVVYVPTSREDTPDNRRTVPAAELI
ncbi:MAG: hypothetical protein ACI8UR_001900 [Natronomonas sp.]|jgi:hypothetical protein|uniref:hypothetical protein n=1 Tax=Natronomonas sp. TaxID=2184060 RepID=UPI0039890753